MKDTFLAIDGNNVLMRAIHALHHRRGMEDPVMATGATLDLFIAMVARRVREEHPRRIIVAWDDARSSWRTKCYPAYKGNRNSAIDPDAKGSAFAAAKTFCHAAGIPNVTGPAAEADDVISWFWAGAQPELVDKLLILSDDRDYAQLLGRTPHGIACFQLRPSDDIARPLSDRDIVEKWGCAPEHIGKLKALMGDSGDNIPGLPGIGPKKALARLQAVDFDLDQAIGDRSDAERVRVALYYELVNLRVTPSPYFTPPRWIPVSPDHSTEGAMGELLDEYKLERVRSQLQSGELWSARQDYSTEDFSELAGRS